MRNGPGLQCLHLVAPYGSVLMGMVNAGPKSKTIVVQLHLGSCMKKMQVKKEFCAKGGEQQNAGSPKFVHQSVLFL